SVSWSCLKKDEDQVFGIAIDLLEHPDFKAQMLMLAKKQEVAGIVRRNDQASDIARREAAILVYGKQSPYARMPEIATVMGITLDDLKAWHAKTLTANNMIVAVSGDFDPAVMEKSLRAAFESLPRGAPRPKTPGAYHRPTPGVSALTTGHA